MEEGFQEIHTPKLIAGSSEGGANVFKLSYFGREACLAQSPQFFKQMAVMSGMKRVFEIGPVFRSAAKSPHSFTTLLFFSALLVLARSHRYLLHKTCGSCKDYWTCCLS